MLFEHSKDIDFWSILLFVIDIGIVYFLFYRILLLLSRTRGIQLLLGVVFLFLADILSRYLNLAVLSWLVNNISTYFVIGVIILIQPELRRLASGLGQSSFFQWIYSTRTVPVIELVNAASSMAEKRIGSIVVILRRIRPENIISQAVSLDAEISFELIETIFSNRSPLHDGAVIVEGNRIVAASCYLPLSQSPKLKKTHGSRHRAGLGISEETDAIVVVTSEESGKIVVMVKGNIFHPKGKEMAPFLESLLSKKG